jgi:hypothetical protein
VLAGDEQGLELFLERAPLRLEPRELAVQRLLEGEPLRLRVDQRRLIGTGLHLGELAHDAPPRRGPRG